MSLKSEDPKRSKDHKSDSIGAVIHSAANLDANAAKQLVPRILEAVRTNLGMEVGFVSRFSNGRREFLHVSSDGLARAPARVAATRWRNLHVSGLPGTMHQILFRTPKRTLP